MPRRPRIAVLAALALVVGAAGCGPGQGEPASSEVSVRVTRDFGTTVVREAKGTPPGRSTVLQDLQRSFDVREREAGFVQAINGVEGGRRDGRPVDWFYFVNGILAEVGSAEYQLTGGERVWWDHRDWGETMDVRAVVGSFPEPFVTGYEGKRLPLRLDCVSAVSDACDVVEDRLADAGVERVSRAAAGSPTSQGSVRVVVGPWRDIRRDQAVDTISRGPADSGVYARIPRDLQTIELLDERGEVQRTVGADAGLIAATRLNEQGATWVVTGLSPAGVRAAAAQLTEKALARRFAAVVEGTRVSSLPVARP